MASPLDASQLRSGGSGEGSGDREIFSSPSVARCDARRFHAGLTGGAEEPVGRPCGEHKVVVVYWIAAARNAPRLVAGLTNLVADAVGDLLVADFTRPRADTVRDLLVADFRRVTCRPCREPACGRPLRVRADGVGNLLVADFRRARADRVGDLLVADLLRVRADGVRLFVHRGAGHLVADRVRNFDVLHFRLVARAADFLLHRFLAPDAAAASRRRALHFHQVAAAGVIHAAARATDPIPSGRDRTGTVPSLPGTVSVTVCHSPQQTGTIFFSTTGRQHV